ncbi:EAL domain-containing protein [Aidingimonas halophila]|uniref:EAL domain, c-di-GMP-specific phosphodiesterase class I (Or its enzymatically inactive variant) n=1 Tax=Aidingimonas halophila TaxID=574349 RepID=A0A1H2UBP1_9GAMM|nr:EAL domain-containing protein [Aidingimonas halophila]GHC22428.1 diguanylate phosphodiesterase [Aidingimonas halophila]SDW53500.1 EAL domain, c-di-GMP-specific phosphodiesterase class I (or its enzymatically inactive variant) [Aidingimonas halophila]
MGHCARVNDTCGRCDTPLPFDFTMAFQPIVDVAHNRITTHEALVRGPAGESAFSIISQVTQDLMYRFDQSCRVKAIQLASRLGMQERLSINFLPNAVYAPEACIQATLEISKQVGWPAERIVFEITETELVEDRAHLSNIIDSYRSMGFMTALDDFGNGYANLDLLTDLHPDFLKIDRELVQDCDHDKRRQSLLNAIIALSIDLGIQLIAEGVETQAEACWLASQGIVRQQGYFYAKPSLASLAPHPHSQLCTVREAIGLS